MRIAVFHNLPSGGAKRALLEAVSRLSNDHHLDVFTLSTANHIFADLRPWVKRHEVFPFTPRRLFNSPFGRLNQAMRLNDLNRIRTLAKEISKEIINGQYDVFFAQPCQIEISTSILLYLDNTPKVYFCQEPLRRLYEQMPARPYDKIPAGWRAALDLLDPLPRFYHAALRTNDWNNTRSADRILVNSKYIQQSVETIYQTKAELSYLGVDAAWFQPLGLEKKPFLLSVGSLTPLKGFDFLIEAIGQIPKPQRLPLVIASNSQNPPERAYLCKMAERLDVELRLSGNVTEDRLRELYNEALMTVYAPIREPFGLVSLESMACGTPVVGVREGGLTETIIPGETGYTVERDPSSFAGAVQTLLADPGLARELGNNGRDYVLENWTWDQAVKTLEGHFEAVIH